MSDAAQHILELRNIEFRNLYKEIAYHSDRAESIITSSVLYTGAFLGAILSLIFVKSGGQGDVHGAENIVPGLFLLPILFILPSMLLVWQHLNSVVRIASYIEVFFEESLPNEGIAWQKDIQGLREMKKNTQDNDIQDGAGVRLFKWAILWVSAALAAFCIAPAIFSIAYFYEIGTPVRSAVLYMYSIVAIMLVAPTIWLAWRCSSVWSTRNFGENVSGWNTLKGQRKVNNEVASPST